MVILIGIPAAPEACSREPVHTDSASPSQAIDTWALGCVFSEAATWVVSGWVGLERFRQVRLDQTRKLSLVNSFETYGKGHTDIDCFHDGNDVLRGVHSWHQKLRGMACRDDYLTTQILDLVDSGLLISNPSARLTARQFHERLKNIEGAQVDEVGRSSRHGRDNPSVDDKHPMKEALTGIFTRHEARMENRSKMSPTSAKCKSKNSTLEPLKDRDFVSDPSQMDTITNKLAGLHYR
jgi:hypothetical protein